MQGMLSRGVTRLARAVLFCSLALSAAGLPASGQSVPAEPSSTQVSRPELQRLLAEYTKTADSRGYSPAFRARARAEAALIRGRLTDGDLQVGDRVQINVEGLQALSDTFTVVTGRNLVLPMVGSIPLSGVLRSEIEPHLAQQIGRFVRDPVVHARTLLRVSVMGAVGRQGFFLVPSEALLSDVLMAAGGPAPNAELQKIRVEREGRTIWPPDALQQAITEGRTLDQLSLRAGDLIVLPEKSRFSAWGVIRDGLMLSSAAVLLVRALNGHY